MNAAHGPAFSLASVQMVTDVLRDLRARMVETLDDALADRRREESLCAICYYYHGRLGAARTTRQECGCCRVELLFPSSCVDLFCLACALVHRLCKHCGADVELRERRKL